MDNRLSRTAEGFIVNLTGAGSAEVKQYMVEFSANREFQDSIEEKQRVFVKGRRYTYNYGIGPELGLVIYVICRRQKPDVVIETGVASGVSSSYILSALEQNERGQLYSIDLPWWQDDRSGWLIPDYLRHRWHLILGSSAEELAPLLKKVNVIDIFLHDSDHSYKNMLREFETAWASMKAGALLMAHNIDSNKAFPDFCRSHGVKGHTLGNMGGVVKA
jgi:predicted O-methyltransferase YrrM